MQHYLFALTIVLLAITAQAEEQLALYAWADYMPPKLLERFTQETGIRISLDSYNSNAVLIRTLRAGAAGYDVVLPSGYLVKTMIEEGLAVPIHTAEMSNFAFVRHPHSTPVHDPERRYSAPFMWGTTGLAYNAALVNRPLPASWEIFFNPPEFLQGQILALADEVELYSVAAFHLHLNPCTERVSEARQILNLLEAQKPHLAAYVTGEQSDALEAGQIIMQHLWSGRAHRVRQNLPSVVYLYPAEGVSLWEDNLVVPRGAPNVENARTFINWMMDPRNIAEASNYTGYMNAIAGSEVYMSEALAEDPAVDMPAIYTLRLRPIETCSATAQELRRRVWRRLHN